jgi:plastocyanin
MRPSTALFLLPAVALAQTQTGPASSGATHAVAVGKDGLTFSPDSVDAAVGDQIVFSFYPSDHAVVRSTFDKPCSPLESDGAVYSGFPDTSNGMAVRSLP